MLSRFAAYAVSVAIALVLIGLGTCALGANLAHATPLPGVTLQDAVGAPVRMAYVPRNARVTFRRQCPSSHYFTEVSAYTWQGRALGPQRTTGGPFPTLYWQGAHGPVVFDGRSFLNLTGAPVLVAGWCS